MNGLIVMMQRNTELPVSVLVENVNGWENETKYAPCGALLRFVPATNMQTFKKMLSNK